MSSSSECGRITNRTSMDCTGAIISGHDLRFEGYIIVLVPTSWRGQMSETDPILSPGAAPGDAGCGNVRLPVAAPARAIALSRCEATSWLPILVYLPTGAV